MSASVPPTTEPTSTPLDLANFRDLGDLRTVSDDRTKRNRLFRSAAPGRTAKADPFTLVVDLRCASEEALHPIPSPERPPR
jgi:hypothetical protein